MKDALRKKMRGLRARWTAARVRAWSGKVRRRLAAWPVFRAARVIAAYRATPGEPELGPLLRAAARRGVRICVPAFDGAKGAYAWAWWTPGAAEKAGQYGITEPARRRAADPRNIELVLVPGLAFDAKGRRLGRGGGHYDRLLARTAGLRVGVAFEAQLVRRVPRAAHDVNMDAVATDERMYVMKESLKRNPETAGRLLQAGRS
ncbi:MAG TPA: 5-formyltetrahydrofolate cyclo-ligase [Kiritimatiellia bacterium]|nr:5-formyltetrahydrofolate cyclo-ligase [Kiritimatiellia bacterium]HRZ11546.1 5-formyltetrahydrofolate cyclo-ligase [Kiritimatiellia bacterium]HSA16903.1 5-formyltetrahydrofolate cyclo-ligase [Kiritimatiellia bacterium]